jgi:hypothetical protein
MLGPSGDQPPSSEPSGDAAAAFACFWQERRRAASLAAGESMWQHRPGWVFLKGHCVRSLWDGWGQVVGEGVQPLVRFLDGHECRMSADTLTYVPDDVFEDHIANRTEIEQSLTSYVYGHEALHPSGRRGGSHRPAVSRLNRSASSPLRWGGWASLPRCLLSLVSPSRKGRKTNGRRHLAAQKSVMRIDWRDGADREYDIDYLISGKQC